MTGAEANDSVQIEPKEKKDIMWEIHGFVTIQEIVGAQRPEIVATKNCICFSQNRCGIASKVCEKGKSGHYFVSRIVYTRPGEEKQQTQAVVSSEKEVETKDEKEEDDEGSFSLFKKKRSFSSNPKTEVLPVASRETQLVSNSARDWLKMPKRRFANEVKEPVAVSKPLPSEEDEAKEKERPVSRVKTLIQPLEKEPVVEGTDWGDSRGFDEIIEDTRRDALKEWEEMRKPDEWDMAIDKGKTKKVRKNKLSKKRARKNNPFQEMAEKKHSK